MGGHRDSSSWVCWSKADLRLGQMEGRGDRWRTGLVDRDKTGWLWKVAMCLRLEFSQGLPLILRHRSPDVKLDTGSLRMKTASVNICTQVWEVKFTEALILAGFIVEYSEKLSTEEAH